ncbi:hypothetical protein D4759_02550 [Clostridiales bacterium AHG0011]|nr:hypothetical protein [Clostridiales bacterium AHG0011]
MDRGREHTGNRRCARDRGRAENLRCTGSRGHDPHQGRDWNRNKALPQQEAWTDGQDAKAW